MGHSLLKLFGSGAVHPTKDAGGQLKDGPGAGAGGVGAGGVGGGGFGLGATGLGCIHNPYRRLEYRST